MTCGRALVEGVLLGGEGPAGHVLGEGAGPDTDAQVLVWTDMAGLTDGRVPRFSKQYANLRETLGDAARAFAVDVAGGAFPAEEHTFH